MSLTGQTTTYINNRGFTPGTIAPVWKSAGITHGGVGIANTRGNITFAKIWGSKRNDFIFTSTVNALGLPPGVHVWQNQGKGGTTLNGDGVYYCDMTGDGLDDYIYVTADGNFELYGNQNSPPSWKYYNHILSWPIVDRRAVHFADWNGDGRCDILFVDKATGAVRMLRNDGFTAAGTLTLTDIGIVSSTASCNQGWGVGRTDLGLRFADIGMPN